MANIGSLVAHLGVDTSGLRSAGQDFAKFEATTTTGLSTIAKGVTALAGSFAVLKMAQLAKDAALSAARYETLGVVMKTVGNNTGYTGAQMEQFAQGLQKSGIAMVESRAVLTRMAQAHIDLAQSTKLSRIAQDAAVIGNINSSEAFERMIHGIQSGQIEVLRNIGLNVNFESSYAKLAAQLGKNAKELTELEKMQARTNVVMEAGVGIAGTYEASMTTAGKQILSMTRYWENLKTTVGGGFLAGLAEGVAETTGALKGAEQAAKDNTEAMQKLSDKTKDFVSGAVSVLKSVGPAWSKYGDDLIVAAGLLGTAKIAQYAFNLAVSKNPYVAAATALLAMNEALRAYNMNLGALKDKVGDFRTSFQNIADVIRGKRDASTGAVLTEAEQITRKIAALKEQLSAATTPEKPWYLLSAFGDSKASAENVKRLTAEIAVLQGQMKNAGKTFFQVADAQKGYQYNISVPGYDEEGAKIARAKAALAQKASEDALLAGQKGAQKLADEWAKTKRGLEQELNLQGLDGLEKTLQEITNRVEEIKATEKGADPKWLAAWEDKAKAAALHMYKIEQMQAVMIAAMPKEQQAVAQLAEEYKKKQKAVQDAARFGVISQEQSATAIAGLVENQQKENLEILNQQEAAAYAYDSALEELGKTGTTVAEDLSDAFTGWASNMSKDLNDVLWGAKATFSGILESFGKMVTQMYIQKQILEPATQSGGWIDQAVGFVSNAIMGSGGGTPEAFSQVSAYDSMVGTSTDFSMAGGGIIGEHVVGRGLSSGKSYEFGENGPEAVLNKSQIGGSGGQGLNVEVNVINQSGQDVKAKVGPTSFNLRGAVVNVILEDVGQNGPLRGLFAGAGEY